MRQKFKNLILGDMKISVVLVVVCVFFTIMRGEAFLTAGNFFTIARQVSMMGIVSVGMTFVMLIGGFDLSVGSLQGLIGVTVAVFMVKLGLPIWLAIIGTIVVGGIVGAVNGLIVTRLKVNAFITTLSTMTILKGVAFVITGAFPITNLPKNFQMIGQGYIAGLVPIPVIIMAVVFVLGSFILNKTYLGRDLYSVGGNEEASRLSGINVNRVKFIAFISCGVLGAVSGMILAARLNSGQPAAGDGFEFNVITACVLGGVSLDGGEGRLAGVLIGVLIMGVLANGMTILGLNDYYQWIIKGLVLIMGVAFDGMKGKTVKKMGNSMS